MKIKTCAMALCLTLAPAFAMAEGCNYGKQQVQSCAAGSVYDTDSGTCVQVNA